ncbi:MAG: tRNA (adenosine(37)-N6)-threonylcarbamoyltransferase complex transferase subunit TsaD, partial [Candidatus Omnitrophica bacterium]|nr:tRNA (adenosine(37)-N6)-threonylcarbamoyltransferase complex transferase subunit TsaD [Candidatus Omnitrophota bacterium]
MITLGVETSCDETSCAILENGNKIRSNIISSSLSKHQPFGGVVPEIASRHSLQAIHVVYETALSQAKVKSNDIDLIAVTQGPGLVGSLLVGVSFAKSLAFAFGRPLIGVHHLEAHLAANFILREKPKKPFIGLIVSGGHTSLVLVKGFSYEELGSTVDDAIGEAYDKTAKILDLGYPGGPVIDRLAQEGNPKAYFFTKPKVDGKFNFSFSGIKTAVLHLVNDMSPSPLSSPPLRGRGKGEGVW